MICKHNYWHINYATILMILYMIAELSNYFLNQPIIIYVFLMY